MANLLGPYWDRYASAAHWRRWADAIDEVTGWLWDAVAVPVLTVLKGQATATVVPCGLLGALPVHAAWTETASGRHYLMDELSIRYTPNASTFASVSKLKELPSRRALVIAEPSA